MLGSPGTDLKVLLEAILRELARRVDSWRSVGEAADALIADCRRSSLTSEPGSGPACEATAMSSAPHAGSTCRGGCVSRHADRP
jgi:hypothetical protein